MQKNIIQVIYGVGKGKSAAAIGQSVQAVSAGKRVVFISFLKGKNMKDLECIERLLEPDSASKKKNVLTKNCPRNRRKKKSRTL